MRLVSTLVVAVAALAVAGTAAAQQKSRLQEIQQRGTLKVGTTGDFNPMSVRDAASNSFKGFEIDGNIAFENGCLANGGDRAPGILVGGGSSAERIAVRDNVIVGGGMRLGYPWGTTNEDLVCTNNYAEGLVVRDFRRATVMHNTLVASSTVVSLEGAERLLLDGLRFDENNYYVTDGRWGECSIIEESKSRGLSFSEWRSATGLDANSTLTRGDLVQPRLVLRPNAHQAGRAHLAILNPAELPEVEVDVSGLLQTGQSFRLLSVKDPFGEPLVGGEYAGEPLRVPMRPVTPRAPVGMRDAKLPVTEPRFAAFLILAD